MWQYIPVIPVVGRLRQEETSLGHRTKPYLKLNQTE